MKNKVIVEKILRYAQKVLAYTKNTDYDEFTSNSILIEACVFNLSQIGELANKIDKSFEKSNSHIPWRMLYGLRNKIVHDYEGVNLTLIWEIVKSDLQDLIEQLNNLYETL
ncbi:MAG: DUF86 domain-containing protein [Oscillospiraceae bacterium]|nr:DUF86 domain-containing protein [Oscillospiraceae bacterium]